MPFRLHTIVRQARRAGFLAFSLMLTAAHAQDAQTCKQLRFADIGWTDLTVTNALATAMLRPLGYTTSPVRVSVPISFVGLQKKQVDESLGYWWPNEEAAIKPYVADKSIMVLPTPNLDGAMSSLAVPTYEAEAGLKSYKDLARYYDKLGGKIYGIESGSSANNGLRKLIASNAYGLGKFTLVESSEASMLAAVNRAVRMKQWIVFWGWQPHPMNEDIQMTYLQSDESSARAARVYTAVASDFMTRCPNAARLISNLQFSVPMESQLMGKVSQGDDANRVALGYLKQHPEVVSRWTAGVKTFDGGDASKAVAASLAGS
jgi:glycine betaine/proline transport system substrate-binding protein